MSHNTELSRFAKTMKQIDQKLVFIPRSREELAAWWGGFSGSVCAIFILLIYIVIWQSIEKQTVVPTQRISHPSDKVEFSQRHTSADRAGSQPRVKMESEEVD